jgi:exonuclease III
MNTRTLTSQMRQGELCKFASEQKFAAIAIQEHRIVTENKTDITTIHVGGGWTLEIATANPQGQGGVGFLLSPEMNKMNPVVKFVSDRLLLLSIKLRRRKMHLFCVYCPTAPNTARDPGSTADFMSLLDSTLHTLPTRDIIIVAGDFNATLPTASERVIYPVGTENDNTTVFTDFLVRHDLFPINATLRKKPRKLQTFEGPRNRRTRLDYICVPRQWRASITNCDTIRPAVITSDHRLLFCTLRHQQMYTPAGRKVPQPSTYWPSLKDKGVQQAFTNRVDSLLGDSIPSFAELARVVTQAATETLPKLTKRAQKSCLWKEDATIADGREKVQQLVNQQLPDRDVIHTARQDLEDIYTKKLEERITEQLHNLNSLHEQGKSTAIWRAIDDITQRKARPKLRVHAESEAGKAQLLKEHFQQLLNNPSDAPLLQLPENFNPPQVSIDTDPITLDELRYTVKSMASFKAPGPDGLPAAVYKTKVLKRLLPIMNSVLLEQTQPPPEWLMANVVPIPKKGDLTKASNYRGISLMSTAAKLYNKVLLRRLEPLDRLLLPVQSGFRARRGTAEQVLAARLLIDRCRSRKKTATIVYVDFKKAFDSVNRSALSQILALYGVPPLIVNAVMALYGNTKSRVKLDLHTYSDEFETTTGVLQGDSLAPFLFVIVLDFVLRVVFTSKEFALQITTGKNAAIGALVFADDIALLASDPAAAQVLLSRLVASAQKVGLEVNTEKTEYMVFPEDMQHDPIEISGQPLKQVPSFIYLGVQVSDSREAFRLRRAKAWAAASRLSKVFHSAVKEPLKVRLFQATVESVLFYGTETLTITKSLGCEIDSAHSALLRHALGIHWPQKVSNEELYKRANCPKGSQTVRYRRLQLYGKVMQHRDELPARLIIQTQPVEKYRVGGHRRLTFEKIIADDLSLLNCDPSTVLNKKAWNEMCNRALATQ